MPNKLKILIIEDSEDDALLELFQINKGGYEVHYERIETAHNLRAALQSQKWDIILSDYKMPNFNGLEALSIVKESEIDVPFIIVSGTIGEDVAVGAMKAGAHDYIIKGNLNRLLPAIEREIRESKNRAKQRRLEHKEKLLQEERLSHFRFLESMDNINRAMQGTNDLEQMMGDVLEVVLSIFACDRAFLIYPFDPDTESWNTPIVRCRSEYSSLYSIDSVPNDPYAKEILKAMLNSEGPVKAGSGTKFPLPEDTSEQYIFKSFMGMTLYPKMRKPWGFGIHQCSHVRQWKSKEERLMQEIGRRLADVLTSLLVFRDLKESEQKFSSAFQFSPSALTVVSLKDLVYLDVNERFLQTTGYERDEIIGHSMSEINLLVKPDQEQKFLKLIIEKGSVHDFEYEFQRKDKSTGTGLASAACLTLGGQPCMITQTIDITKRKQTELQLKEKNNEYYELNEEYINLNKELQDSSAYNRMLFDLSPIGLALAKITGELVDVNQAYADIINYTIEETLKLTYSNITPAKYAEQEKIQLKNLNEKGFYGPYEKEYVSKSGKLIPVRLSGRKIERNGEKFIWSSVENIAMKKQFEEEIKQNEFRLSALIELSNQKTLPLSEIYNFVLNKSIELCKSKIGFLGFVDETEENIEIFAWSENVVTECSIQNRTTNFVVSQSGLWGEVIRQRKPIVVNDYSGPTIFNKGFPLEHVKINNFACFPFFANEKIVAVVSLANKETDYNNTDITQLNLLLDGMWTVIKERNYQSDLITAKEKAEESDRLKTAFLQNMSHEIRTPMNAICGFSDLLNNPDLSLEKRKVFISIIQNSSHQLLSIVTDILTISSIETKQEKLNINKVFINDVITDLLLVFKQQSINQKIALYAKKGLNDIQSEIYTDKTKITQILTNLLTNAFKFTHEGFIEIGYTLKPYADSAELEFYVKDSGIGIKPEWHEKIFERFLQADNSIQLDFGGTGLGLSISKGFVELLGGKIWVKSEFNEGSTFYFTTPYKPVNEFDNTLLSENQNKNIRTILIAEDEEYNFLLIEEFLKKMNFKLIHVKNGKETIDTCLANPNIDLVLMDIKMPIITGDKAAKLIKEFRPDLTIIALSGYALKNEIGKYNGIFDDYVTKPVKEDILKQVVFKYFDI